MCGRNDGPIRWAMEAIAAGVGGAELATWTLAREDERAEERRQEQRKRDLAWLNEGADAP